MQSYLHSSLRYTNRTLKRNLVQSIQSSLPSSSFYLPSTSCTPSSVPSSSSSSSSSVFVRSMSTIPPLTGNAKKRGAALIWGRVEDKRLGMKLPDNMFSATDTIRGPTVDSPLHNPHLENVKQMVTRRSKSIALTEDGTVYTWGTCENLSLGHGESVTSVGLPRKVEALKGIKIVQIDANETSTACISSEGEVFTWGWGGSFFRGNAGLGHGDNVTQPQPALIESLANANVRIVQIAVGNMHMLGLSSTGIVYSWGNSEYGRCGNGKTKQLIPEPVQLLQNTPCIQVAAGQDHSLAVTKDGKLYAWGKNEASQLGLGGSIIMDLNTMEQYPTVVELEGEDGYKFNNKVVRVAAGTRHSLALTRDGSVWQFGGRTFIQPTLMPVAYTRVVPDDAKDQETSSTTSSSKASSAVPPTIGKEDVIPLKAVDIAAGDSVSGAIDANGQLFTWGRLRHSAMLGHGSTALIPSGVRQPTRVDSLKQQGVPIASVTFGTQHAAAVVGIPRSL